MKCFKLVPLLLLACFMLSSVPAISAVPTQSHGKASDITIIIPEGSLFPFKNVISGDGIYFDGVIVKWDDNFFKKTRNKGEDWLKAIKAGDTKVTMESTRSNIGSPVDIKIRITPKLE